MGGAEGRKGAVVWTATAVVLTLGDGRIARVGVPQGSDVGQLHPAAAHWLRSFQTASPSRFHVSLLGICLKHVDAGGDMNNNTSDFHIDNDPERKTTQAGDCCD